MIPGTGIAFFGVASPLFWMSLLSGNSAFETWVYGLHSLFFIVFSGPPGEGLVRPKMPNANGAIVLDVALIIQIRIMYKIENQ